MNKQTNIIEKLDPANFSAGVYIRLSKEDAKKEANKSEEDIRSESIKNQKTMLVKYVKDEGFGLFDIYIDDDYTGQNFDRPDFKRMIEDIEKGKVNCVITKDLSRLGRDYIETGEYVQKWFPKHNIRYIAIMDQVDTFLDSASNDFAPHKMLYNDQVSRDNSKKIRAILKSKQEDGAWVGGTPPFGYSIAINDDGKKYLKVNEDEAPIVRKVRDLAKEGNSLSKIIDILFDEKIPTPTMVRKIDREHKYADLGYWNCTTIKAMLKNELYTGDLVQNRRRRISYKVRDIVQNDRSDWIIIPDAHEAIISKEDFNEIQRIMKNSKGFQSKKKLRGILDGLIYCGECKTKLGVSGGDGGNNHGHFYTYCYTYRKYSKLKLCTSHCTNFGKLESAILGQLRIIFDTYISRDKSTENLLKNKENIKNATDLKLLLKKIEQDLALNKERIDKMLIEKIDGKIPSEQYDRVCASITKEIKELEDKKNTLIDEIYNDDLSSDDVKCMKLVKEFVDIEKPSREVVLRLIKRIEYHQDKTIDIYFNFRKLNILVNN